MATLALCRAVRHRASSAWQQDGIQPTIWESSLTPTAWTGVGQRPVVGSGGNKIPRDWGKQTYRREREGQKERKGLLQNRVGKLRGSREAIGCSHGV